MITIVVIGLTAMASNALAAVALAPGGSDFDELATGGGTVYSGVLPANVIAANLIATLSSPYSTTSLGNTLAGTLVSQVYRDPVTQFLTFVYKDTESASSTASTLRITLASLWRTDGLLLVTDNGANGSGSSTAAASGVSWTDGDPRFILWDAAQKQMDIQFRNAVGSGTEGTVLAPPGDFSALIFFATNAKLYTTDNAGIIDGVTSNAPYLGPTFVPEPATLMIWSLLAGVGITYGVWRRKRAV